jgi:hypothetical protein
MLHRVPLFPQDTSLQDDTSRKKHRIQHLVSSPLSTMRKVWIGLVLVGVIMDLGVPQAYSDLDEAHSSISTSSTSTPSTAPPLLPYVTASQQVMAAIKSEYTEIFGDISRITPRIAFVDAEEFHQRTKMPRWTSALYVKNRIILPVDPEHPFDSLELERSLRHEYVHAIVHSLTKGKCPGWIDEGLAQWLEGGDHVQVEESLSEYLYHSAPLSLSQLQGGFTQFKEHEVAPAYGQALFAVRFLIRLYGLQALVNYLHLLSIQDSPDAFIASFGISLSQFETTLGRSLKTLTHR